MEGQRDRANAFDGEVWLQYLGMTESCPFYRIFIAAWVNYIWMQPVQCFTQFVSWGISHNYVAIKKCLNINLGNAGWTFA